MCLWASYFPHLRASQVELEVKNPPANAGNTRHAGSIPGLGKSPGGGNSNSIQYCCLGNPMDKRAWWAIEQCHKELDTTEYLCTRTHTHAHTHTHTEPTHIQTHIYAPPFGPLITGFSVLESLFRKGCMRF